MSQATASPFRVYAPDELGPDGYPPEWHRGILLGEDGPVALPADIAARRDQYSLGLKDVVRADAGNRCVRCGHPYQNGQHGSGEWSPCDIGCAHLGPIRWRNDETYEWVYVEATNEPGRLLHDGYTAEYEAHWRILTVHHLDGVKGNCRWFNLAALCQRCHLTIQGRVQMARIYPWEHSSWFRPYVAGYYAWTYLREDLTRAEVEARLGELLALELAA